MIDLLNLQKRKERRLSSLLGLSLHGSRLEGVVLRKNNGALEVQQTFSVSLSLDPLTADVELVGRELRNHLDAAGVRERYCVMGLPLKWALTTHAQVPDLPEADMTSLLQIEAERGFAADASTLHYAASKCRLPDGKQQVLLVGVPKNHLVLMEQALRAARLKPISFSLGITALQPPSSDPAGGTLALVIGDTNVGLEITCGGGIAALRALEGALEVEGTRKILHADLVAREARITLGQLPAGLRENVRRARIFGPRDLSQQLADEIELRLESMGLKVEPVTRYASDEFGLRLPAETPVSPAASLAAGHLGGRRAAFELLPPRVTPWQQMVARYSSGKFRMAGATAGVIILIAAGAFLYQQWDLIRYRSRWKAMATKVRELENVTQQIHQYRPWFDDSLGGLTILRQVTTAFPEDGVVTAKSVEIRDMNVVTCTGTTRDNDSLLRTLDRLRTNNAVSEVRTVQIRGSKPPLQFTFDFHWTEGGRSEN
jgi:hypothetical protein